MKKWELDKEKQDGQVVDKYYKSVFILLKDSFIYSYNLLTLILFYMTNHNIFVIYNAKMYKI